MPVQTITRVFLNDNSQAVRIPKEFHLDCSHVSISREGDRIVLMPLLKSWVDFFAEEDKVSADFMDFDRFHV